MSMRILWVIIIGASTWPQYGAAGPMQGCKLAIIEFKEPAFELPPCDEDTRWPMPQSLHPMTSQQTVNNPGHLWMDMNDAMQSGVQWRRSSESSKRLPSWRGTWAGEP